MSTRVYVVDTVDYQMPGEKVKRTWQAVGDFICGWGSPVGGALTDGSDCMGMSGGRSSVTGEVVQQIIDKYINAKDPADCEDAERLNDVLNKHKQKWGKLWLDEYMDFEIF